MLPGFLVQFGINLNAEIHRHWQQQGNIPDDARTAEQPPFRDGVVSFAGYSKDSRSTHLFITLGDQPGLGQRPWEVPVGQVTRGMEVVKQIYSYGDKINQGRLSPGWDGHKAYVDSFPKLDYIRGCKVVS